jgi:lysophospholipase L1-like esterase
VNGFTTADLIARELPRLADLQPDFVTILIGVNDVVQRVPADTYRAHLDEIFSAVLDEVPASRIVVVSTPDYTLTPSGSAFGDPAQQSAEIARFNDIERENAQSRGIAFVDISSVANRVPQDAELVASDGLHPSGKQYAGWAELVAPIVEGLLTAP